jgi:hypothetical protein
MLFFIHTVLSKGEIKMNNDMIPTVVWVLLLVIAAVVASPIWNN